MTVMTIHGNFCACSHRPMRMTQMTRLVLLVTAALLAGACGASETIEIGDGSGADPAANIDGGPSDSCNNVGDLRVGLPLFDYDRAEEITDLVAAVDVVLQGTLGSAAWVPIEGADPGEGTMLITPGEFGPLTPASPDIPQSVRFEIGANGHDGNPHPLGDPLVFPAQTQFIAFAYITAGEPDVLQLHAQGLYLRCPEQNPAVDSEIEAILEPLPADVSDLSFFELVDTIGAVAPPRPPRPVGDVEQIEYRVLAEGLEAGQPWTAAVIDNADALAEVAPGLDPLVDFETEVVFALNPAESGSCPFGPMEGLEFETLNRVLYPAVPLAEDFEFCTSDANPHLILVAVVKADLPEAPFDVWVNEKEPPSGVVDGVATYLGDR